MDGRKEFPIKDIDQKYKWEELKYNEYSMALFLLTHFTDSQMNFIQKRLKEFGVVNKRSAKMKKLMDDKLKEYKADDTAASKDIGLPDWPTLEAARQNYVCRPYLVEKVTREFNRMKEQYENRGGCVLIYGMGGAGKTSLTHEIIRSEHFKETFPGGK